MQQAGSRAPPAAALVLSGGVALCAYEAGAYEALHEHPELHPTVIAGSSGGAVTGALIAGNPPEARVARLREFWDTAALEPPWACAAAAFGATFAPSRIPYSMLGVAHSRTLGRSGVFRPRVPAAIVADPLGIYELSPMCAQLECLVDFERLNRGSIAYSVTLTDVVSGEQVVFGTRRGDRISAEHLAATCGFLPEFPPQRIDGRLLGDGGLSANAPVECALQDAGGAQALVCFVVDVFASSVEHPPATLDQAAGRRWDLLLGNQTRRAIDALEREHALRRRLGDPVPEIKIVRLAYRAATHELGLDKMFDFSRAALTQRWRAGYEDMCEAIALLQAPAGHAGSKGAVSLKVWS